MFLKAIKLTHNIKSITGIILYYYPNSSLIWHNKLIIISLQKQPYIYITLKTGQNYKYRHYCTIKFWKQAIRSFAQVQVSNATSYF